MGKSSVDRRTLDRTVVGDIKRCPVCKEWKHRNEYYKRSVAKYNIGSRCKKCSRVLRLPSPRIYTVELLQDRRSKRDALIAAGASKRCCNCEKIKSYAEFGWSRAHLDGTTSTCRLCNNAETRSARNSMSDQQKKNRKAKNQQWRERNPDKVAAARKRAAERKKHIELSDPDLAQKIRQRHYAAQLRHQERYHWMKKTLAELGIEIPFYKEKSDES